MSNKAPYDKFSAKSIIDYAKKLKDKSLNDVCDLSSEDGGFLGKGNFGQTLEKHYFGYEPNSDSQPDFPEAGLELKTSPLKILKNKQIVAKERLVLNIINYMNVHDEDFTSSSFWKKNAHLLLIFYLHEKEKDAHELVIKLIDDWIFPEEDLKVIMHDWKIIQSKIKSGNAHELSEGDTFYLGACTKGSTAARSFRQQPFSNIQAKQRAFSLKQGYVNQIISNIANEEPEKYGRVISNPDILDTVESIEDLIINKFTPFIKLSFDRISDELGVEINKNSKGAFDSLTNAILNDGKIKKKVEELVKADIRLKTIRISANNKIKESVSFPAFKFENIYNNSWRNSKFKETIERRFLFVFFKDNGSEYILDKIKFWTMPYSHRQEARRVWLKTKEVIQKGQIFKDYKRDKFGQILKSKKGHPIKLNNLPKAKDSDVIHVRPHGSDSKDVYRLPVMDKKLKIKEYSKQCFWIKATYIRDEVYLENENLTLF